MAPRYGTSGRFTENSLLTTINLLRVNCEAVTPQQVGVPILKALGRTSLVRPGLLTKILSYALLTAPRALKVRIMGKIMGGFTGNK